MFEGVESTSPESVSEESDLSESVPAESGASTDHRALLPQNAPTSDGFDVAGGTTTDSGEADTVWDWVTLSDGSVVLLTFGVAGEGMSPTHHLHAARVLFRALAISCASLPELLEKANQVLASASPVGHQQFVECGAVRIGDGRIEWGSAGRVPAGVIRRAGTFDEAASQGPPLGMMEGFRYAMQDFEMGAGDVLIVLSRASAGLFRGAADLVAEVQGKPAGEVVRTLHRAIRKAGGEAPGATSVLYVRKN